MKKLFQSLSPKANHKRRSSGYGAAAGSGSSKSGVAASDCTNPGTHFVYSGKDPSVDIIAIHGHNGHWRNSWTDRDTNTFWLKDLLPRVFGNEIRVVSFGYDSNAPVEDVAGKMLEGIERVRRVEDSNNRPIIFLAHSFGGLVLKGGLAISHTTATYLDILSNTHGILLFGVPQDVDKGLSNMVTSTPEAEESALVRDAKWLGKWVGKFDDVGGGTEVVYFKESSGVENQTTGGDEIINGRKAVKLSKTHGAMIRFANVEDKDFLKVMRTLDVMINQLQPRLL